MAAFISKRLVLSIPVLFGILALTFVLNRSIPGDPCRALLGEKATQATCNAFIVRYGLDQPLPTQFAIYIGDFLRGDFGDSLRFGRSVKSLLIERLPVTIELAICALIFATFVGVFLGVVSAYRHNQLLDTLTMIGANVGVSMPVFWLGLMLAFIFGVLLKDTPFALPPSGRLSSGANYVPFFQAWGIAMPDSAGDVLIFLSRLNFLNSLLSLNTTQFIDTMRHMILPAVAVGTIPLAIIARITRSSMLEVLGQDYIRTARAKGLAENRVLRLHALSNALLPVVTIIGLNFGALMAGAVLTETIFGLAGIGKMLSDGITARDYALVQGVTVITAVMFLVINLIVDVLYSVLDPRIRLG